MELCCALASYLLWLRHWPGVISQKTGPVSFVVQLSNGRERRCHQDQLKKQTVDVTVEEPIETELQPHVLIPQNRVYLIQNLLQQCRTVHNQFQKELIHHLERLILPEIVQLFKGMNQCGD